MLTMKRRIRRYISFLLIFIICFHFTGNVSADQISDLKKKNEEDQQKLDALDEQIDDLASEQAGIQSEMDELEAQIVEVGKTTYRMYILQGMVMDKLIDLVKVEPITEAATKTTTAE